MQISDLARHYTNTSTSAEGMNGTRGVEKLVSSVRDLTAGNVFEGTVNSVQNGKVILGLSNGTELTARLDANMQLVTGQSMFFQVKCNDGATIAIRPYTVDGSGANLTLLNALKAAGLPVTDKYLNMVNAMMQEQMPIDKNSMMQMARILMANPDMSVNTAVQMKKLDIPITNEMAAQFENYMDDTSAVHKALDQFITELPTILSGREMPLEQLKILDSQLLQILADGMEEMQEQKTGNANSGVSLEKSADNEQKMVSDVISKAETEAAADSIASDTKMDAAGHILHTQISDTKETIAAEHTETMPETTKETMEGAQAEQKAVEYPSLEKAVKLLNHIFGETGITTQDSPASLLHKLAQLILHGEDVSKDMLERLFSSKSMTALLKDVMEEQMYLLPKDAAEGEKIKKLYSRLETKSQELEHLLLRAGLKDTPLAQTITDVRANIEFMNQLNQTYTYVQIPLRMSGQNTSGELYVYTNKRDLGDSERDLTAFLHLDMDHLGSTDVSVRLHKKNVDTKFYMESDESYALVKAYMPRLEEALRKKGFHASVYVESEGKKVDFVQDFLKKDAPSAGQLHRYSFDVRA